MNGNNCCCNCDDCIATKKQGEKKMAKSYCYCDTMLLDRKAKSIHVGDRVKATVKGKVIGFFAKDPGDTRAEVMLDSGEAVSVSLEALEPEEQHYWTGKVVCTESCSQYFTKGKVYSVFNGIITDDTKSTYSYRDLFLFRRPNVSPIPTAKFIEFKGE